MTQLGIILCFITFCNIQSLSFILLSLSRMSLLATEFMLDFYLFGFFSVWLFAWLFMFGFSCLAFHAFHDFHV